MGAKIENPFETAKQALIVKPKTISIEAFNYKGSDDLKNLIDFVGTKPKAEVNEAGTIVLSFKKWTIVPNRIIFRNSYGEVVRAMTYAEAAEAYDISGQNDFSAVLKNKVQPKPEKEPKKK